MYSDKMSQEKEEKSIKIKPDEDGDNRKSKKDRKKYRSPSKERKRDRSRSKERSKKRRSKERGERHRSKEKDRKRSKSRERDNERRKKHRSKSRDRKKSRSKDRKNDKIKSSDKKSEEKVEKNEEIKEKVVEEKPKSPSPLNYDSDSFIEMIPAEKKRKRNSEDIDSNKENGDIDPLDNYMKSLVTPSDNNKSDKSINKKSQNVNDDFNDEEEPIGDFQQPIEEETLESITKNLFEEKSKKLPEVNHDKVFYRKYDFNLYNEVPEIKNMTVKDVKDLRKNLSITIKGKDCPKPITKWGQAIVNTKILAALRYNKMTEPTPIQSQTIPAIMSGKDVIGIAKTGSGKTLAYLLPMIRHIQNQPRVESGEGPISIVLCPTRELSIQIYQEIEKITSNLKDVGCCCIYGGSDIAQQINKLKKGVEIVVGTPGRIIDILCTNAGRNLNMIRCTFIVLDEADRMFDMGFEPQVFTIVQRIRPDRQTVMFSATFPRKIEAVAKKILKEPIEVRVGGGNKVCNDVTQYPVLLSEYDKFMKLHDILSSYNGQGKCLVFVEKQETAVSVSSNLNHQNIDCDAIHGGMSQETREEVIMNFKNGKTQILIATSIAARGLDVHDLVGVINYDCPSHYEDYVHRCGRTGRAGNKGDAYTFITPDQEVMIGHIIKALKSNNQTPSQELIDAYERYKERMNKEGKAIQCPSGFRGHGFKFDASEAMKEKEKKLQTLKEYCPDEITEEDEAVLEDLKITSKKGYINNPITNPSESQAPSQSIHAHIQIARNVAMNLDHRLETSGVITRPIIGSIETVKEEMDINNIPANIRYLLTTKDLRTNLFENFNVTLLVKGVYMSAKEIKKMKEGGEKPLHLLLESDSMMNIAAAKKEINRTVKEALNKN